jgi:excisionase family DNA binding protein
MSKKDELLTKEQIAAELSDNPQEPLSIRSVERYIQIANIRPTVRGTGRGHQSKYSRADVDKLIIAYRKSQEARETGRSQALTTTKPTAGFVEQLVLEQLSLAIKSANATPQVSLEVKIFLTLKEAAALSGLSHDYLLRAIKDKKLKARLNELGRGYRIKRTDLEVFANKQ